MFNATPLLRLYASFRNRQLANQKAAHVQQEQLFKLISYAKNTEFGHDHHFDKIKSVKDFQALVPLRSYEQFWQEYWQTKFPYLDHITWPGRIPFYAVSSGTSSGRTKYIPLSNEMIRSNVKAGTDILVHHVTQRPQSQLFGGKSFVLGGSTDLVQEAPGIWSGDLSGIAVKTLPWWAAQRYFPPPHLALLKNWEEKVAVLAEKSLKEDIRMISGVPSWMLIFFEKLWKMRPEAAGHLHGLYKNLEMIVHGGVNFAPYRKQFEQILQGSHAELREVYPASEGFIGVADRRYGEGLRLILDHGIFFEFVPLTELNSPKPIRHWIDNVHENLDYAIVLTSCAGLWSYVIGDTVRFVDVKTPRLLVTGRTSYYLSAFGEHLTGEEVDNAISTSCEKLGLTCSDYSVGAIYPKSPAELGGHLIVIEFADHQPSAAQLLKLRELVDQRLCALNDDYDAHRAKGYGLNAPVIHAVAPGFFRDWMKSRGKLGGQHKVPRIISDNDLFTELAKQSRYPL